MKAGTPGEASTKLEQNELSKNKNEGNFNKLLEAAKLGELSRIKSLEILGVDIHSINEWGRGALNEAAVNGHADVVEYIMQKTPPTSMVATALGDAISANQPAIALLLVENYKATGNDYCYRVCGEQYANTQNNSYLILIRTMIAFNRGIAQEDEKKETVQREIEANLLEHSVRRPAQAAIARLLIEEFKITPDEIDLETVISRCLFPIAGENYEAIVRIFIDNKVEMSSKSILHLLLSSSKTIELAKYAINKGYSAKALDENNNTPLHILMGCSEIDCETRLRLTKLLVENHANVNSQNTIQLGDTPVLNDTPLHILVRNKNISYDDQKKVVRFLMSECGADEEIRNSTNSTVIMSAGRPLQQKIIKIAEEILDKKSEHKVGASKEGVHSGRVISSMGAGDSNSAKLLI
jgi:ankyrin repeat protein